MRIGRRKWERSNEGADCRRLFGDPCGSIAIGATPNAVNAQVRVITEVCKSGGCETPNDPADDLDRVTHDHNQQASYYLHSQTLNGTQRSAITEAALAWRDGMGKDAGGMDLNRGPDITTGGDEPTNWNLTSVNAVWEDNYPVAFMGCDGLSLDDPYGEPSCTFINANQSGETSGHRHHGSCTNSTECSIDTVFEESLSWWSDKSECGSLPPDAGRGNDIDHGDGLGGFDFRGDQQTVAAHEFGHWYAIRHSSQRYTLMYSRPSQCFVSAIDAYSLSLGYNVYEEHH